MKHTDEDKTCRVYKKSGNVTVEEDLEGAKILILSPHLPILSSSTEHITGQLSELRLVAGSHSQV